MKKYYEKPSVLIEKIEFEDIITTSDVNEILKNITITENGNIMTLTDENVLNSIDYTKFKTNNNK